MATNCFEISITDVDNFELELISIFKFSAWKKKKSENALFNLLVLTSTTIAIVFRDHLQSQLTAERKLTRNLAKLWKMGALQLSTLGKQIVS